MKENSYAWAFDVKTPCFIFEEDEFVSNLEGFQRALKKDFSDSDVAYSVKTNALPYILRTVAEHNGLAEVVSADEFRLAEKVGFPISRIVYNGPMKDRETFFFALEHQAYVNIETNRELQWLREYSGEKPQHLGLRLNIDLGKLSPEDAKPGEEASRFGFSYESGDFLRAIHDIENIGFAIHGIHAHRTSRTRSLRVYQRIAQYVSTVAHDLNLSLSFVDMGGGFFGNMPGKPDYQQYADVLRDNLDMVSDVKVIVEPGNALVASPVEFCTSILDTKILGNEKICSCDGSRIDIDPFFHKSNYQYILLSERTKEGATPDTTQVLTGCTCLESDRIMSMPGESVEPGDRLLFFCVGAYTMGFTPNFIRLQPCVYVRRGDELELIRDAWTTDEWMQKCRITSHAHADRYLFTNAGRRVKLLKDFKAALGDSAYILATDNWSVAPALFAADKYYLTPKITDKNYVSQLLGICDKEKVQVITSCIDPEIEILANNRETLLSKGILPLCPSKETAQLCFDKYKMYLYLKEHGIETVETFSTLSDFQSAYKKNIIDFPVFIKPRTGSGSVGAEKIATMEELEERFRENKFDYIIQEFMDCEDCDADVYIDTISNQAVAAFSKKKIETKLGGASKTISFKDDCLFAFIQRIVKQFKFYGPVDMDFFYRDGVYYLSEVNPRFGGAYLHAFGSGVDFPQLIRNNLHGIENKPQFGKYDEGTIMLMYDDVIMTHADALKGDYRD